MGLREKFESGPGFSGWNRPDRPRRLGPLLAGLGGAGGVLAAPQTGLNPALAAGVGAAGLYVAGIVVLALLD